MRFTNLCATDLSAGVELILYQDQHDSVVLVVNRRDFCVLRARIPITDIRLDDVTIDVGCCQLLAARPS